MKISSDEITSVIKKQIENYKVDLNVDEVGTVLEVGDGIAHVYGPVSYTHLTLPTILRV